MSDALLELHELSKRFGNRVAINSLSVTFSPGEVVLLVGPNGSGKSTFLKLCAGLYRADSGLISKTNTRIGYFGHELLLYPRLTVSENIRLFLELGGDETGLREQLGHWQLAEIADEQVASLSRGNRVRTSLCRAFIGSPKIILLDEPTSNLDSAGLDLVVERSKKAALGAAQSPGIVLIASHDVERLSAKVTRVLALEEGKIVGDSKSGRSASEIVETYRKGNR